MRVLIIPEDPTLDQHVLKPVVEHIFQDLGRAARVEVLVDPHLSGIDQALDANILREVVEDNAMVDLFVLIVDRDCDRYNNSDRAGARGAEHRDKLVVALAREEVEIWALALHRRRLDAPWKTVQQDCDPKEKYFDPFIRKMGWLETVGKGRKKAMQELGRSWSGLLQLCPEVQDLKSDIQSWLARAS